MKLFAIAAASFVLGAGTTLVAVFSAKAETVRRVLDVWDEN